MRVPKPVWIILSFILLIIPHIRYLSKVELCGWDCGWYVYHLAHENIANYHHFTEPLYFWLFKPFVMMGIDPILVMKGSMIVMLLFAMWGMYILCNRLKMNLFETILVIALFVSNPFIYGLWNDTLRNFLSFSFIPYFLYYLLGDRRKDIVISYIMIILMGLSHRMVLAILPMILLFRILNKQWKRLTAEVILAILFMVAMTFMTDKISGLNLYGYVIVKFMEGGWFGFWPNHLNLGNIISGLSVALGLLFSIIVLKFSKEKGERLIVYTYLCIFTGSLFFSKLLAHRPIMLTGIFMALISGLALKRMRIENRGRLGAIFLNLTIVMALSGFMIVFLAGDNSEEIKFINNIDLPEGSILLVPDRLYFYAQYKHPDLTVVYVNYKSYSDRVLGKPYKVVNHPTPKEADVYRGINAIGNVYYLDGCHFSPRSGCPLVLKYSERNVW